MATYGLRYQSDFYNYFGKLVSVKIYKQDYADSVEDDVRVSEVTITANYQNDNTPIIGTGAKIVIAADTYDMSYLEEMLLSYERQYLCTITYDGTIVFRGFSLCDLNERQLLPYANVTLQFTDYLRRLEDKYSDSLSNIGGKSTVYGMIADLIELTNVNVPLYVNSTLFEDSMDMEDIDSFLPQVYVQNAQFYSDSFRYDNAYEAVNKTLQPFSGFLYYYKDNWILERQEDITRTGNWVLYNDTGDSSGATDGSSAASLKLAINKQNGDFEYVGMKQVIEYDAGLQTLILKLNDKIKETFVYNNYTTDILSISDSTPEAGSLTKNVWYKHDSVTNVSVGTKHRHLEQYIKWDAANIDMGLYYSFEIQFNTESDETTELTINYKASAEIDLTGVSYIYLTFYLRVDGGSKSGYYIYQEADKSHLEIENSLYGTTVAISIADNRTVEWDASVTFNFSDIWGTYEGLTSIWEELGYPEKQKFILMINPARSKGSTGPGVPTLITTNYIGDVAVTVNEAEIDNKIEYRLNENFVKTDEIDLYLFDLDNINYSNGLLNSDGETLTNLWTSENSAVACPLYEVFAKGKFRKYGRTIHRLKASILLDKILKVFTVITDDNVLNSSDGIISFLLNGFTWDLNNGIYQIEAEEYTEEEIIVSGVTYDSLGNPEEPVLETPANLVASLYSMYGRPVHLTWNPVGGGITGYKLKRRIYYSGGGWVDDTKILYTGTNTEYTDFVHLEAPINLPFETLYYSICSYNATTESAYCAEVAIGWAGHS